MGSGAASHNWRFFLGSLLLVSVLTPPQAGAKALYDAGSTKFVGLHYWFEDSRGQKFVDPSAAGVGRRWPYKCEAISLPYSLCG